MNTALCQMRFWKKVLGVGVGVTLVLLLSWVSLPTPARDGAITLLITTNVPAMRQSFFTACLTNNTTSAIGLDPLVVQVEDDTGRILNNFGENWTDKDGKQLFILPPGGVAFVSPQADPTDKRLRVIGEYSCVAPALPRFLSRGIGRLPPNCLPRTIQVWLLNHGLVDGSLHGRAESPWMLNPAALRRSAGRPRPAARPH